DEGGFDAVDDHLAADVAAEDRLAAGGHRGDGEPHLRVDRGDAGDLTQLGDLVVVEDVAPHAQAQRTDVEVDALGHDLQLVEREDYDEHDLAYAEPERGEEPEDRDTDDNADRREQEVRAAAPNVAEHHLRQAE